MPYTATNWVNGSTPANATNLNHLETQYTEATSSFNQDEYTPYILSGFIASKDATTASQLDLTAGVGYVLQADSTTRRRALSSTTKTTSAVSSTYYLYLQPDGTLYWATTNTPATNSLFLAQVTTDSSGNISGVTDKRTLGTTLFSGKDPNGGALTLPAPLALTLFQNASLAASVVGGVTFGQSGLMVSDFDTAALFNGTSGYVMVSTSGFPTAANAPVTLEVWIRLTANPSATVVPISAGATTGGQTMLIAVSSTGTVSAGNNTVATASSSALTLNVAHHLVATYDGTNLRLYVDGALIGTPTAASITFNYGVSVPAAIGAESGASPALFTPGTLGKAAFYSTALSATRVSAHYNARTAGYDAAVLADAPLRYYKLADAVGATLVTDTISPTATPLVDASGTLKTIGGQATVGSFGAPVIVAQFIQQHITNTSGNSFTFSIPASGLYRVSVAFRTGIASANVTLDMQWTDETPTVRTAFFTIAGATSGVANALVLGAASAYAGLPLMVYAAAGYNMTVIYSNSTATPNDYLNVFIERLS